MIENITWLDFAGVAAVVTLVYAGLRLYVAWWIGSGRAARVWVKMNHPYTIEQKGQTDARILRLQRPNVATDEADPRRRRAEPILLVPALLGD